MHLKYHKFPKRICKSVDQVCLNTNQKILAEINNFKQRFSQLTLLKMWVLLHRSLIDILISIQHSNFLISHDSNYLQGIFVLLGLRINKVNSDRLPILCWSDLYEYIPKKMNAICPKRRREGKGKYECKILT